MADYFCSSARGLDADRRRNQLHLLQIVGSKRRACSQLWQRLVFEIGKTVARNALSDNVHSI